jgi:hypothetical protein
LSDATVYALLSTAALTALLHTLIPDHWLPFVLMGRAQNWSAATVALVSGLSAVIHTSFSLALGLMAVGVGLGAAEAIGETLERAGAGLLIVFGVAYALWAWRKGGHFHPGGALLHGSGQGGCLGDEGPANPEHLHYHADEELIRGGPGRGAIGLAVIVGVNPCVLVLPVMLAAAARGGALVGLVALSYGIPTVALVMGLSVIGARGGFRIHLPWAARFAEQASGILIALLGVLYWVLEG